MNTITIKGNAGRDAEVRGTQSGKQIASLRLAVYQGKDKPAMWLDIDAWDGGGWQFERLSQVRKGQSVVVVGRLGMREWQDKDGATRQAWSVTAFDVELCAAREEQPRQEQRYEQQAPARPAPNVRRDDPAPYSDGDSEIPF